MRAPTRGVIASQGWSDVGTRHRFGQRGPLQPANYVDPTQRPLPPWGKRADRAYLNAIETFAPFAALVILIHLAAKANATTAILAASFFWLRVAHAVVFWAAISYVRTIVFTLGYVVILGLFYELMF